MQTSFASKAKPEEILEWLQNGMGYRHLGFYSTKHSCPSTDSIRKVCRGNMIPVWNFLVNRVKSEKMVDNIRKNIVVHGTTDVGSWNTVGRKKSGSREVALQERELAEKEVERLRWVVKRKRKELKDAMVEVSKEEGERKRMLDERANYRHNQVMLEAYDRQCDESTKVFSEYHKRLIYYVTQVKDAQSSRFDSSKEMATNFEINDKDRKSEAVLIQTDIERKVRKASEYLATLMSEKVQSSFSAYEGSEIHVNLYPEDAKLGFDTVGNLPTDIGDAIADCLSSPTHLLKAITSYTQRLKTEISRDIEKIDVAADVEALRYKYENGVIVEASSPDKTSQLPFGMYVNGKLDTDTLSSSIKSHLTERQQAHVQQFLGIENAFNEAAEARTITELLLECLHGSEAQDLSSLRKIKLQVWSKEREAAGLRASVNTLISEVHRLNNLCEERKEAESSFRKKLKKIEEYDACRFKLESVYNALLKANMDAVSFLSKQALVAKECAPNTILPACNAVMDLSNNGKDHIENEVSAFHLTPSNSLYMLPSTPQALMESMGVNSYTGPEAVATAERNATLLTARAGAMDPSAIPSICRISTALQYPAGLDGMDSGLAAVLESMDFCLKPRGSEACILEDLAKAIHVRRDLVESGQALLTYAHRALHEYDRTTTYCQNVASEQEKIVTKKWLPELSNAAQNAERCLQDLRPGLFEEWLEPASTVVDWVSVDGVNVSAWQNNAKQLNAFFDESKLDKPSFWQSYLNLEDRRFKLSQRCPHCVKLYFS